MGYSNGQVQSSSDSGKAQKGDPGLPGIGFNLTDDGNFDIDSKRLTDLADPVDNSDAATKNYVLSEKKNVLLLDGSEAMKADLKMSDKKITNLATPTDGNDGATKGYVDDQIHLQANKLFDKRTDSYDLHPNFSFYPRGFLGGNINTVDLVIPSSQSDSFINDHQHGKVYQVIMNTYFNQLFLKRFTMTNNQLKPGNYTAIFELFSVYDDLFINDNSNMYLFPSNSNYLNKKVQSLIINNNYKKIIFQFEVIRNPVSISGEFVFNKAPYRDMGKCKCLFFHHVIEGFVETDFDHGIFNADPTQIFFLESLSLNDKKITDLANGTVDDHAVNLAQLKSYTDSHQNNYHLRESFSFYKNYGDQAELTVQSNINVPNHGHHDLYVAKKEGSDSGFIGQAWVSLKMTNNLPVGIYTVVFELFSGISGISGSVTQLNNETLLQLVFGDANYKIITFSHDYQTTHSKAYIQFNSNGQAGEITFQIRYYGSSYNNPSLNFLFFSRVISGKIGTAFNHALFDVDDVQLKNQILYFEDVNLNENKIKGLAAPSEDKDGANKKYVDDQIKAIPVVDTSDLLKLDGSRAMTGNLQMGHHTITGIRSSSADNAALTVGASKSLYLPISGNRGMQGNLNMGGQSIVNLRPFVEIDSAQPAQDNQVINYGYFRKAALKRKNPDPMESPINMGNNFITNIKDPLPTNSNYAVTVNFVNRTVSDNNTTMTTNYQKYIDNRLKHTVQSTETSNAFQYVMDDPAGQFYDEDDIKGIKKTNKDYHKINKETYEMQLLLDSIGYYSSRLGVNMYILPNGEYSLVYELCILSKFN